MGLTRQAVQRVVDEMRAEGFLRFEPNPHHRRASLITMTEQGMVTYRVASERQESWAETLVADLPLETVEAAGDLLRELQRRLVACSAPSGSDIEIKET